MVIVWPVTTREYLLVLPPSRWEVLARNLQGLSLTDERAALVERLIGSSTSMGSLDKYGRLPLPEDAAKAMGIENEAMLVGRMNKFEVWSPARFAATLANPDAQADRRGAEVHERYETGVPALSRRRDHFPPRQGQSFPASGTGALAFPGPGKAG